MGNTISDVADFKKDVACGHDYEQHFLKYYNPKLESHTIENVTATDFKVVGTEDLLELKTEAGYWFSLDKQPMPEGLVGRNNKLIRPSANLFIERWSVDKEKEGGPWQAKSKGAKYYVHYFPHNGICLEFDTEDVLMWMNDWLASGNKVLHAIKNKSWVTTGYAVSFSYIKQWYKNHPELIARRRNICVPKLK